MDVICAVSACPFRSSSGFCRGRIVTINQNGGCGHLYDKQGQIRRDWQEKVDEKFMRGGDKN